MVMNNLKDLNSIKRAFGKMIDISFHIFNRVIFTNIILLQVVSFIVLK